MDHLPDKHEGLDNEPEEIKYLAIFYNVVNQAIADYKLAKNPNRVLKDKKYIEMFTEAAATAEWFLFEKDGLENTLERYGLLLEIEPTRKKAQTGKMVYRNRKGF